MRSTLAMMRTAAGMIASSASGWTAAMNECGMTRQQLELLTDKRLWTPHQRRQAREALADLVFASLTIAGLPATRVPVEYVAACIAETVCSVNWLVAAHRAPGSYRAYDVASGDAAQEVGTVDPEILVALIMQYATWKDQQSQNRMNVTDEELVAIEEK